ncbi:MAG: YmdB family metallophosphoesterase [Alphaproteobacteria bacterium]|nr:YmdB family metallophosphoesterase [Alphaproteobacteria bacterium]
MRTLFLGDIVGRAGRDAVLEFVPRARQALALDFVIVNGENAAGGFGITDDICHQLFAAGVDVITGGNHSWDQSAIIPFIEQEPRLLRPLNHVPGTPGRGCGIFTSRSGQKVLVINALGQVFMDPIDNPFLAIDGELKKVRLGATVQCVVVDFHAEATSEKMAMGHYLDGRVTAVVGSHAQVPTADAQLLPNGTAYQSDAGMCGDYNSVIGVDKEVPIGRFLGKVQRARMVPANGPATVCGVFVQSDDVTGKATFVAPLRDGGRLRPDWPVPP